MIYQELPLSTKIKIKMICNRNNITKPSDIETAYNNYVEGRDIFEGLSEDYQRVSAFDNYLANGGHIYSGEDEDTQQMQKAEPNIFQRPDGSYFYQVPGGEEIDVTPINTLSEDNSRWTYTDASGRVYNPAQPLQNNYSLTEAENANAVERAINNYTRELAWREANDPASIALQGKYMLPAIGMSSLAASPATLPYLNTALASGFGAHGIQDLANGNADWQTALDVAPLVSLAKPMAKAVAPALEWAANGLERNVGLGRTASGDWNGWIRIGNNEYRPNRSYLGMNKPIERRSVQNTSNIPLKETPAVQRETVLPDIIPQPSGMTRVLTDDINAAHTQNMGTNLRRPEAIMFQSGDDFLYYPVENESGAKNAIELLPSEMDNLKSRYLKYIDKNTQRTRYLTEEGTKPYKLEDLVENGKLKDNTFLEISYPGSHGKPNWFDRYDDATTRASKYLKTKYSRATREDMMRLLEENPYYRSGVVVKGNDYDFSIDSFDMALKNLEKNLSQGRRFSPLNTDVTHIRANDYGQAARYTEEFTPEFAKAVREAKNIPEGIDTYMAKDGTLIFQNPDKTIAGKLRPRSAESIINDTNSKIKALNEKYNLNLGYARLNARGKIEWPNIYGVLYKKGGNLNDKRK